MTIVELNGFDESGNIGENLRFTRVAMDVHDELRPFIYNLLHFGSLTVSKKMVRGQSPENRKAYVRAIFDDPSIQVNHYAYPPTHQLDLLRYFSVSEFARVGFMRTQLIDIYRTFGEDSSKDKLSKIISDLEIYINPHRRVESFIKSYAYRMIIEDLKTTSRVLSDSSIEGYLVLSLVDGGFPFVFWNDSFLKEREMLGERFSTKNTPVIGITHGDQYYPGPAMAGNVSTILNTFPEMIFPQNVKELPLPTEDIFRDFYREFRRTCQKPRFLRKILFFGRIDPKLQFVIPYIQYKLEGNRIYEPFRVSESFRSFYKEFGGSSKNDIIVQGELDSANESEKTMATECKDFGLDTKSPSEYFESFQDFLGDVRAKAKESNLGGGQIQKIERKLESTSEIVKRSLHN